MKHTKQLFLLLLLAIVSNVAAWGQKTYKLEQVTEVQGAAMYVFEQGGYVMNNTVSSNALQTTNSYLTTGLTGSESYVWKLEAYGNGYRMRNMSLNATTAYLNNTNNKTDVSFSNVSGNNIVWTFSFETDGTVIIQNYNNSSRFLGFTNSTSHAYKAYAATNLSSTSYPHAIKVYKLVEETVAFTIEAISNDNSYGTVSISGNTITATPATGYQVSTTNPYTVTSGTATVEQDGNTFAVTPSENCTVQINFEAIPNETNLYIKANSAPYVYTWTGEGSSKTEHMGSWPGTQTTETEDVNGITWHKITVTAKGFNLILNTGNNGTQTSDINNITEDKFIVWNADGLSASQYVFVDDYATVTASDVTVGEGRTANSNITSTPAGLSFSYSSDNTNVATVANDGTITGVAQGSATITVSWNALEVNDHHGYPGGNTTFTVTVTEAETERTYVKVTSKSDIEDGKKYLIVYEDGSVAFDGSRSTLDAASNNMSVTISDNTITTSESIYFTIDKGTILSASGKYIGRGANSNGMDVGDSPLSNNISISDGNAIIVGDGGANLRYNSNSDQQRFRYFSSSGYSNQKAIQLYKEGTVTQEVTLYVKADSAPFIYTWTGPEGSETKYSGNWPGTQATGTKEMNGVTWYKYTVPAKGFNLILNTGNGGTQTSDINNITEDKYIVWNSAADGYAANKYLFVDFATVSAQAISVRAGKTVASNVTTTPEGLNLTYQSGDTSKATVDSNGNVTGVAEGTAIVKVSWNTQEVGGQGYLGGSTTFTVTVTPASTSSDVFVKATNESDLQDGMQIIIVNEDNGIVMGAQKENNFGGTTVDIDTSASPYEATPNDGVTILTLEGSSQNGWYFKDENDMYLYAASSDKNYLKTESEKDDNAKATISFSGENNDAVITFQGSNTRNIIRFNNGNAENLLFSCYASGQNPVQIYYREGQTIVARPTISPASGTYTEAQTVTITNNAEGATVYYTTDGTTPTTSSTVYTGPFTLSKSGTYEVKAIAVVDGNSSSVATSTITIQIYVEAPTISPEDGTQITEENKSISISSASGLTIYYTTDGTDPVKNGELTGTAKAYSAAFTLTKACTVKAVARDAGGNFSTIVSATYTYNGTATLPYYERFDAGLGNFITVSTGTVEWKFREHTSPSFIEQYGEIRKYAYAANYDSKLHTYYSGNTRFVSPILDLTEEGLTNVILNFIHAGAYFGSDENLKNRCKVQIITNEGGIDLSSTTVLSADENWTNIEVPTDGWFVYSDEKFTRKNSGDIDLTGYVGNKVRIGFWYNAGEIDNTHHGTWNVDQISIRGELIEKVDIAKPSTSPETETEGYTTYVLKNDIDAATTLTGKGVKLYKVVEFDKRNVVLVQLGLGEEGEGAIGENTYSETMVPAGSPVLVKGEFGERELVLVNSSEVIPKLRGNLLRSAMEGVTATENDHFFVLQYPKSVGAYGFHLLSTGRSFDGRRAYLNGVDEVETLTTQTNSAKGVFLFGEEEDVLPLNIQQLDVPASSVTYSDGIFDLMGRKVNTSNGHLPKGIYVVKGKKFVVK